MTPEQAKERGIKVKPLEWDDFGERQSKATAMLIASYMINRWSNGEFEVSVSAPGYSTTFHIADFYPSMGAAKTAVQADYEARILEALE